MLTISGEDLLRKIVPGWNGEKTELEQPDAAPEPETKRCRRGKHIEVSEEDKQRVCSSFAS